MENTNENIQQTNIKEVKLETSKVERKFPNLKRLDPRAEFLEKLDFIATILKTAETNEIDENKKKEIQEAISVVEARRNLRKKLKESLSQID